MMKIHAALIIHIHASPDVADLWLDNVGDDSLSLLQLRAHTHSSGIEECVLVEGDAVSSSWAIAYDATNPVHGSTQNLEPGGSGIPVLTFEECYQRVKSMNALAISRNQPPPCSGLSLPTGGQGQCYCQRQISATDENPDWQSCKFGGFTEADLFPGQDKKAAEELGCFFTEKKWGSGGRYEKVASAAKSKPECINLCKNVAGANGVTMDRRTPEMFQRFGAGCWCHIGQTGQSNSGAYENCELGVEPEEVVIDGVGFDGSCSWQRGSMDGNGGPSYADTITPKARSPEHCAQMVRQQCPDANAAYMRVSGSGECFCLRNSVREQCIPESLDPPSLNCPNERTWMNCNTLLITTTTTSTTTAEAGDDPAPADGDDAAATGDPHITNNMGKHLDYTSQ